MSEPIQKHIDSTLKNGVGIVRFRYSKQRSLQEYDEIEQELYALANGDEIRAVLLNLDDFDYVPSRFLGTLVGLSKKLTTLERQFAICRMHTVSESAFLASRLDKLIAHYVSEEDACAALGC